MGGTAHLCVDAHAVVAESTKLALNVVMPPASGEDVEEDDWACLSWRGDLCAIERAWESEEGGGEVLASEGERSGCRVGPQGLPCEGCAHGVHLDRAWSSGGSVAHCRPARGSARRGRSCGSESVGTRAAKLQGGALRAHIQVHVCRYMCNGAHAWVHVHEWMCTLHTHECVSIDAGARERMRKRAHTWCACTVTYARVHMRGCTRVSTHVQSRTSRRAFACAPIKVHMHGCTCIGARV